MLCGRVRFGLGEVGMLGIRQGGVHLIGIIGKAGYTSDYG